MTLKNAQKMAEYLRNTGSNSWCQGIADGAESRMVEDEGSLFVNS